MISKSSVKNSTSSIKNYQTLVDSRKKLEKIIAELIDFLEHQNFQGWEPYDIPEFKNLLTIQPLRVFFTQLIRLSPILMQRYFHNKNTHAKAATLFAHAFLTLYELTNNHKYYEQAIYFLDWLQTHRCPTTRHFSIGNQYHLSMKNYCASPGTPAPLITCFAIEAFLYAYEILKHKKYLQLAESGIYYFLEELPQIKVSNNQSYFIYHPKHAQFIPNLPAVVSGTLSRFYWLSKDQQLLPVIKNNFNYIVKYQREDGSWFYHPSSRYIDNFHTAFILEALEKYHYYVKDDSFETNFLKGLSYYEKTFFKYNMQPIHKKRLGLPTNVDSLLTKIDLRDISMGLILFSFLAINKKYPIDTGLNLFNWCTKKFRSINGYFYYQKMAFYTIKGPFLSMQAWMLYALAKLFKALKSTMKPE